MVKQRRKHSLNNPVSGLTAKVSPPETTDAAGPGETHATCIARAPVASRAVGRAWLWSKADRRHTSRLSLSDSLACIWQASISYHLRNGENSSTVFRVPL